ncbi:hypothetical protein PF007_g4409 [Phytophthora fragariae]|uniref:Kinesin motor domain-containing protein n=1 Tax=Phytophthora fragariae TaxID=53985 RepID=A0A6A3T6P4_9STRA|nr:hypothetical protein PF007_g4409 [Phytophthora fragariae]
MKSTSDFNASLRQSRSPSGTTPRAASGYNSRGGHPYAQGMSINVSASSSPSGSARSSPHGSTCSPSSMARRAQPLQQQQQQQYYAPPAPSATAAAYLQRTAISNAYNSTGGSRSSEDTETASTSSDGFLGDRPSSPAHSISSTSSRYSGERGSNFKVVIRVRPPLPRELHGDRPFQNVINVDQQGHVLTVSENLGALAFGGGNGGNGDNESSTPGKTYTMEGFNSGSGSVEERGIIPRAIEQIFCHIQANVSARCRFLVRASYLQIYNESISDLLKPERTNLTIREDRRRGVFVEGLSEWVVRSPEEIYGLMERGGAMRATGSTKMNELSSRSHAVFIIIAEQSKTSYVDSKGNDVAPEEFMALVNAYQARHGGGNAQGNGGGNGKAAGGNGTNANGTAALHPKLEAMRLRAELEERSRNVVDKRRLLELDEQRRRAEEDKMAAIRALEERSREFMREKEEKKRLEQRISALTSQMLMSNQRRLTPSAGGGLGDGEVLNVEDPLIRDAIKEHQDRIRQEYECRLADLEKERETIEEEKAQVDRYKQLLLKQRDIMIALTQRLNERDEQITALQDELDAYDRHQKELEEKLDEKTAHLIHLQRVAMEHNASSPGKIDAELLKALGDWGGGTAQTPMMHPVGSNRVDETPAELLITHKQFRPHPVDPVIINDNNYSNNNSLHTGSGGASLLSADEKIQELRALVDAQSAEHQRMARELEDVKSEKVSVEFLMREKLDKLVQVELEAHTKDLERSDSSKDRQQLANLQRQLEALISENQQLQARATSDDQQLQLQARCDTLVKERRAVQTIMEHKIKALVTAIGEASDATLQTAGGAEKLGEPAKWLAREVNALQRLVNASIVALRNADAGNGGSGGTSANTTGKPAPKESSSSQPSPTTAPARMSGTRGPAEKTDTARIIISPPPTAAQSSTLSVDELIEQRRAQLQQQRDRYPTV